MHSLWNDPDHRNLVSRFEKLRPDSKAVWGRMSVRQMLAHIGDSMRMAIGAMKVEPKRTPLRFTPIKQLVIYTMPTPRNLPTAPELQKSEPGVWTEDLRDVRALLKRAVAKSEQRGVKWPDHPAFGRLSARAWGVLIYKHLDHHLKQFGV